MSLHSLIHEIHIASSGQLSTLKGRVIDSGLAGPELETGSFNRYYNLAYSHVWREFNKKCYNFSLTNLMVTPYDGGLRPIPPALSGLSNGPTTTAVPTTTVEPTTTTVAPTTTTVEPTTTTVAPTTTAAPISPPANGYLQPDGVSYYLQPDGEYYYQYAAYAHTGQDCETNPVTIYTTNPIFNEKDRAWGEESLTALHDGYFIYNGIIVLYYTNGVSAPAGCP